MRKLRLSIYAILLMLASLSVSAMSLRPVGYGDPETTCTGEIYHFVKDTFVCGDFCSYRGKKYIQSGTYYDSFLTVHGCDSIYQLNLTLHHSSPLVEQHVDICHGQSFTIHGKKITIEGVYYDTLVNKYGCDSIVRYSVTVHSDYHFNDTVSICYGETFVFDGKSLTAPGDYYAKYTSVNGCDSVRHLKLYVTPSYFLSLDTTICGNSFFFNGRTLTESGVYTDSMKTEYGCDSIFRLNLTLNPVHPVVDVHVSICQGDLFFVRDKSVPTTDIYYDTLLDKNGCDSVIRYIFNVHSTFAIYDTVSICQGDYYEFGGKRLTETGDYNLNYRTSEGCDSIRYLHLITNPSYFSVVDTSFCGDYFQLNKKIYRQSGTYYDTLSSVNGCDSIYQINLTLNKISPVTNVNIKLCNGDSIMISRRSITTPGVYVDTLTNKIGCDSVVRYIVTVNPTYNYFDTAKICRNQTYSYHGMTLTMSGDYEKKFTSVAGCDSVYHLHLTTNKDYLFTTDTTVCGKLFIFREHEYTSSGVYYDSLRSSDGCDSVYKLVLTLNPVLMTDVTVSACQGDSVLIGKKYVPASGVYYDTLVATTGCDSIVRYIFNIHSTYHFYQNATICQGDTYIFKDQPITAPGDYTQTYQTVEGCDSVFHLHLTVNPKYLFIVDTVACGSSLRFLNRTYTESGVYFDTLAASTGCDSVYQLNLTLNPPSPMHDERISICNGDSVIIKGVVIRSACTMIDTTISHSGCDSVVRYIVTVNPTYRTYDTVTICQGQNYEYHGMTLTASGDYISTFTSVQGCDSSFCLHLIVNRKYLFSIDTTVCGNSFVFNDHEYTESGVYFDSLRSVNGCDSIIRISLTLHPNIIKDVRLNACQGDSVLIGRKYVPASGVYYDTLVAQTGCDSIVRYLFNVYSSYDFYENASICHGETFIFHDQQLTSPGDYIKAYKTVDNCDSIYHLHLTVNPRYLFIVDTTACGNSFVFNRKTYTESGTYYDTISSSTGCDSIYQLNLSLNSPSPLTDVRLAICDGDSLLLGGHVVRTACVVFDTLKNTDGCDSVVRYIVRIKPTYNIFDTASICKGETYTYHGMTLAKQGDYTKSYLTTEGCDSTFHLRLLVNPNYLIITDTTVCGNSFHFRGNDYTASGVYDDSLRTVSGCDSVYRLILTINPHVMHDVDITACQGDSVLIGDKYVPASGVYYDTLVAKTGCDSIVRYKFNILSTYDFYQTATICYGESFLFQGQQLTAPGDYQQAFQTVAGCDSVYHLHLNVIPKYHFIIDTIACGSSFIFHGHTYTQSGTYYDTLASTTGCDSVFQLNLKLSLPSPLSDVRLSICRGDSVMMNGRAVRTACTIIDTLTNAGGCDSVVRYVVTLKPVYNTYDTASICRGDAYSYHGQTYTKAGDYKLTFQTTEGCDSLYYLHLTVNQDWFFVTDTTICGKSFTYRGHDYTESGVYIDSFTTIHGCDSVYKLILTINNPVMTDVQVNACQGDSVLIGDKYVPASGVYLDTLVAHTGCDSIVRYRFNLLSTYEFYQTATICQGESFFFQGHSITAPGDYTEVFKTVDNCDSIYHLHLTVIPKYLFIIDTIACGNSFVFHGNTYTQSGTYFDTLAATSGCDSVYQLNLTLRAPTPMQDVKLTICNGDSVMIGTRAIRTACTIIDTLTNASGCDSIVRYIISVLPTYNVYDTASICKGDAYTYHGQTYSRAGDYTLPYTTAAGCDSLYHLHLSINQDWLFITDTTICGKSYTYRGHDYTESGVYEDTFVTVNGCDSVYRLILTINPVVMGDVELDACQGDSVYIGGRLVPAAGVYYDTLVSQTGCDSIVRYKFNALSKYDFYSNATICQGESFLFHGQTLVYPGDYTHQYTTTKGCDSTYHLHLTVTPSYHFVIDTTICGTSFIFHNHTYLASGTYYDTLAAVTGCDSVYQLNLVINQPNPITEIRHTICRGDSVIINGKTITTAGTIIDTLVDMHGCDSVIRYVVTVRPHYETFDTVVICRGESYAYHGQTYTTAGDYLRQFQTVEGCDSSFHLHLSLHPDWLFITDTTVCGSIFHFRGRDLTQSGVYEDTLTTINGCDSIYRLNLILYKPYFGDVHVDACQGDSVLIGDKYVPASGVYYDTLVAHTGCDSIIRYLFNVHSTYDFYQTATICLGESFVFQGMVLNSPGEYVKVYQTAYGCDSTYHLHLTVIPSYHIIIDTVVCGSSCVFHNHTYTQSGTYYDTLAATNGCDSVYQLNLTISQPSPIQDVRMTICRGDSVIINGKTITTNSLFIDTLITSRGCDSVVRYAVTVLPTYLSLDTVAICRGETCTYHGRKYSTAGDYEQAFKTTAGCDSIFRLHLTIRPHWLFVTDTTVCGRSFTFRGHDILASGTYDDSLLTVTGCDSIYRLNLTLINTVMRDIHVDACQGDSVFIRDRYVPASGVYYDTLISEQGCDSIVRYLFNVHQSYDFFFSETICQGENYLFFGDTLTTPGEYQKVLKTTAGCDSTFHLHLNVTPSYFFVIDTNACQPTFIYHGRSYTQSGTYYDTLGTVTGCDSIFQINLTLNSPSPLTIITVELCHDDSFYIRGKKIPTTSIYYDTILNVHGCDSVIKYIFIMHPIYDIYDTVSICQGDYYDFNGRHLTVDGDYTLTYKTIHGCDSTVHLHLITIPTYFTAIDTTLCADQFFFNSRVLTQSGVYVDTLTSSLGCDSIVKLTLTLYPDIPVTNIHLTICDGDSFLISGRPIHGPGIYYDSLYSQYGCDSVVRYSISVVPNYFFYDTATICNNQTYYFHGQNLSASGDYIKNFRTAAGCDSVYYLHLTVNPAYLFVVDTIVCASSFRFNEKDYTTSGTYYDSLLTVDGCDSVYILKLRINPVVITDVNLTVCDGDSAYISGKNVPATGIYYETYVTQNGCDSTVRYIFNVLNRFEVYDTIALCPGDTNFYQGTSVVSAGDYIFPYKTSYGCDSVYYLHVDMKTSYMIVVDTTVCGYNFHFNNRDYTASGTYDDTLRTTLGCDSVVRLILTLTEPLVTSYYLDVCQGATVYIRGKAIEAAGVYNDTIIYPEGCYAVDRYVFNVHPNIEIYDTLSICRGDSVLFDGVNIGSAGDYIDRDTTHFGCDSVTYLHLIVYDTYYTEIDTTICEDQKFFIDNVQIRVSGTYTQRYSTVHGCDSTIVYNLTINDTTHFDVYESICEGDVFVYRGNSYTETGAYSDTVPSAQGCDIINTLHLTVNKKYQINQTMERCQNEFPFFWEGQSVYSTGVYTARYTSFYGCDSIITLTVNVLPSHDVYDTIYNCKADNYIWRNRVISLPGDYVDSIRSLQGCDSILHLHYDTIPMVILEKATICNGDAYLFEGQNYTVGGVYEVIHPADSIHCDTIHRLVLTVDTASRYIDTVVTVCNATGYVFGGRILTESGIYYDSIHTASGCYQVTRLFLTLGYDVLVERYFEICQGSTITFRGKTYSSSGVFLDSLVSTTGCDSVYKIVVNVLPSFIIDYDTLYVCGPNDSAFFNNQWYKAGVYYFADTTTASTDPCPTRYRLVVWDDSYYFDTTVVICASDVPFVHPHTGKQYYFSGSYDVTYATVKVGCDSTYHLNLTVNEERSHDTFDTICQGDKYVFNGVIYTTDAYVIDTLVGSNSCDSIDILHLKMIPNRDTTNVSICKGDTYIWPVNNQSYSSSGHYYFLDTLSRDICPTTYVLSLTVVPPVDIDHVDIAYACADDQNINVAAYINPGSTPQSIKVFFDQNALNAGFVDYETTFVGRSFTIPMPAAYQHGGDPLYYVTPGKYNVRIQFDNGICDAQFSEATATIEIRYPSFVLEQNWNDVVAVTRYNHHDRMGNDDFYTFSRYEWYIDGSLVPGAVRSYLYKEGVSLVGHTVEAKLTRTGESLGIMTCPLSIVQMQENGLYPVYNGPANMLRQQNPVTSFSASEGGRYTIVSLSGQKISSGTFQADEEVQVTFPAVQGYYILHVETAHLNENQKVLVY